MAQTDELVRPGGSEGLPPLEAGVDPGPPRKRRIEVMTPYLFMAPAVLLVFAVFVYPVASGISTSLHRRTVINFDGPYVGSENYREILTSPDFFNSLRLSLVFVAASIVLGLLLGLMFALVLYNLKFMAGIARTISLVPWLLSGIAAAWTFRFFFNTEVGLISRLTGPLGFDPPTWLGDSTLALVVLIIVQTWSQVPFATLVLLGGLHMVDTSLYEAAAIDGASGPRIFRHITLPQLWPHIGVSLVLLSYGAWNTFDIVMAMTGGGPGQSTELLAVLLYKFAFAALDFSSAAVVMTVILLINTGLSVFYLRSLPSD